MSDFETRNLIAYALEKLGYPLLAKDVEHNQEMLGMYTDFVKWRLANYMELKEMIDYFI